MKKYELNNSPSLPNPIATLVSAICTVQNKFSARPPHMLVPLSSGNGRSHIRRIIAGEYSAAKMCNFSSREHFLDFTLNETVQRIYEVDAEIQSNSGYANYYHGVISLSIDTLIPELGDTAGDKFFELLSKIKEHATVIIFVPANCPQRILNIIATKMTVKVLPAITFSNEEFAKLFYMFLPSSIKGSTSFVKCKNRIVTYITQSIQHRTVKSIKEAAETVFYNDNAAETMFGKPNKTKRKEGVER